MRSWNLPKMPSTGPDADFRVETAGLSLILTYKASFTVVDSKLRLSPHLCDYLERAAGTHITFRYFLSRACSNSWNWSSKTDTVAWNLEVLQQTGPELSALDYVLLPDARLTLQMWPIDKLTYTFGLKDIQHHRIDPKCLVRGPWRQFLRRRWLLSTLHAATDSVPLVVPVDLDPFEVGRSDWERSSWKQNFVVFTFSFGDMFIINGIWHIMIEKWTHKTTTTREV